VHPFRILTGFIPVIDNALTAHSESRRHADLAPPAYQTFLDVHKNEPSIFCLLFRNFHIMDAMVNTKYLKQMIAFHLYIENGLRHRPFLLTFM
jgi:hypothetical protein